MKNKTKRKLFKLISVTMIIFACLNIVNTIFGTKVYADEVVLDGLNLGTQLGVLGVLKRITGLPLLTMLGVKVLILAAIAFIQALMSGAYVALEGNISWDSWVTLEDIIFAGTTHGSQFLDVNFFNLATKSTTLNNFRTEVAKWYYILRLISTVILLVILIYVGIRMALSTVASEQAKYKKMLTSWGTSFALLFLLHYIIIFAVTINNTLVSAISGVKIASVIGGNNEGLGFVLASALDIAVFAVGIEGFLISIVYFIYIGQIFSFFILYMKRMITVGFLIMIAPLITITYSIDKMGDGKAQALNVWLKELIYNILIQPFHCILYLAFFDAIGAMISGNTVGIGTYVFAVVVMLFMKKAEDILRKIFHFEANTMSSLTESGQNFMNATGKFTKMGMAAGSAFATFNAAGGLRKAKDLLAQKREERADKKLRQDYNSNSALSATHSTYDAYKASDEGKKQFEKYNRTTAQKMKDALSIEGRARRMYDRRHGKGEYDRLERVSNEKDSTGAPTVAAQNAQREIINAQAEIAHNKTTKTVRTLKNGWDRTGGRAFTYMRTQSQTEGGKLAVAFAKDSTKIISAIGMGAIALGATGGLNDAISAGQLGYGLSKGVLENSRKTVTNDATVFAEKVLNIKEINREDLAQELSLIEAKRQNGDYDSKNMNEKLDDLKNAISNMKGGDRDAERDAKEFVRKIQLAIRDQNTTTLELDPLIASLGLTNAADIATAQRMAENYAEFYSEAQFAVQGFQKAEAINMDSDELIDRVDRKIP